MPLGIDGGGVVFGVGLIWGVQASLHSLAAGSLRVTSRYRCCGGGGGGFCLGLGLCFCSNSCLSRLLNPTSLFSLTLLCNSHMALSNARRQTGKEHYANTLQATGKVV